jgi:hypothetical protein
MFAEYRHIYESFPSSLPQKDGEKYKLWSS